MTIEERLDPKRLRERIDSHLRSAETMASRAGAGYREDRAVCAARCAAHAQLAAAYASALGVSLPWSVLDAADELTRELPDDKPAYVDEGGWVPVATAIEAIPVGVDVELHPSTGRMRMARPYRRGEQP